MIAGVDLEHHKQAKASFAGFHYDLNLLVHLLCSHPPPSFPIL